MPAESIHCEPPTDVQPSTSTTTASGWNDSMFSGYDVSNGVTLNHDRADRICACSTYTVGYRRETSAGAQTKIGRSYGSPSAFPASASDESVSSCQGTSGRTARVPRLLEPVGEQRLGAVQRDPHLLERVAVAQGDRPVDECLLVDR